MLLQIVRVTTYAITFLITNLRAFMTCCFTTRFSIETRMTSQSFPRKARCWSEANRASNLAAEDQNFTPSSIVWLTLKVPVVVRASDSS